jgi:hypothetical protein
MSTVIDHIGEVSIATNGQSMVIIAWRNRYDIDVQFNDGTIIRNKTYANFKKGSIANPNYTERIRQKHVGETVTACNGQKMTIIAWRSCIDIDIQFEDGVIVKNKRYTNFKSCMIKNPNYTEKIRKGHIGETITATNGQKMTIIEYRNFNDIDVQFEDGIIVKNKHYDTFKRGEIANPKIGLKRNKIINKRVGQTSTAINGQKMTIVAYRHYDDIDIQFEDGTVVKNKNCTDFKRGTVKNPVYREKVKKDHIGETNIATNGQKMTIIEYRDYNDIDVQFEDENIIRNKTYQSFKEGKIKNSTSDVTFKELCFKHQIPEEKIAAASSFRFKHKELETEQAIIEWKKTQLEGTFSSKCRKFNVPITNAKQHRIRHPELSDEQIIQYYRPDLVINIFGEIIE